MARDFIPRPDAAFNTWLTNLGAYVMDRATLWGHITPSEVNAFLSLKNQWDNAYSATLIPHTPPITAEKNRVRTTVERGARGEWSDILSTIIP